ncbi:MAG: HAMP domain-containing histidine kinase [Muribaculaceae bacterium]|nr:HAMP domain-containing histidine kinase [Muribaculaceae bacterium]
MIIDSLEQRLSTLRTPSDSLKVLWDLFDIQNASPHRLRLIENVYRTAANARDTAACVEAIMYQANILSGDSVGLAMLNEKLLGFSPSPEVKEARTFVKFLRVETRLRHLRSKPSYRDMSRMIRRFDSISGSNSYDRMLVLYSLCTYLATTTQGSLLENYAGKLTAMVDTVHLPMGSLRNLVYSRAAPVYTNNGACKKAVEIDRKLLNIVDSLSRAYEMKGRKFRKLERNRYISYRRMLANYKALTPAEVEMYHRLIENLAADNPDIQRDLETNPRAHAYFYMATGRYEEAVKAIKQCLSRPGMEDMQTYLYDALYEAATRTGDRQTQLNAALQYNNLLRKQLNDRSDDRFRELQIIYDVGELRAENMHLEEAKNKARLRNTYIIIAITATAIVALLILMLVLVSQNRKMKTLTENLRQSAEHLIKERNDLRRAQEELIEARDQAKAADKLKTDFVNNMSHEIRMPLAAVAEYTRLIIDCIPENRRNYLDRFADVVELNTNLVISLVDEVLDTAAIEHGTLSVNKEYVSVHKLASVALAGAFDKHTPQEGIKVVFNPRGQEDMSVHTDPGRAVQVLVNLLDNARKFTDKGVITLDYSVDTDRNMLVFSVTDTGIGIPKEKADVVFDRFTKLDNSSEGVGMGLYISRLVSRLLGGSVTLDTSWHRGARFFFSIPL